MNIEEIEKKISIGKFTESLSENEVIKSELRKNVNLNLILDDIEKEIKNRKINLVFKLNHFPTNFKGQVDYTDKSISIEVKNDLEDDYPKLIFAHEMGEADYILRSLPVLDRESIFHCSLPRITELFSHTHIQNLFKFKNVYRLHEKLDKLDSQKWINKDFKSCYKEEWESVLQLVWALVTYPSFRRRKKENSFYIEKRELVDPLLDNILAIDTFAANSHILIKEQMEILIQKLKEAGLRNSEKLCIIAPRFLTNNRN